MRKGGGGYLDSDGVHGRVTSDASDTEGEREYVAIVKSSKCVLFAHDERCYESLLCWFKQDP